MPDQSNPPEARALAIAEYTSLRAEILKLIELQSQLAALAVVTVGALLGVAVENRSAGLAFVYPVAALILGLTWLNHAHAIARCARYLAEDFEPRNDGVLGWERYVRRNPLKRGALGYWAVRSVFMGSAVVAILVGWSLVRASAMLIIAGIASSAVAIATVVLFLVWREASPAKLKAQAGL